MSDFVVALTGGIGSGKTTIASLFSHFNIDIIDADQITRELVEPHTPYFNEIVKRFGKEVLNTEGRLNRKWLRAKIFSDNNAKLFLEHLLHPATYDILRTRAKMALSPYCLLMIPLLIETLPDPRSIADRILVVTCPKSDQIDRLKMRDQLDAIQIAMIMQTQASDEERLKFADDVIENNESISQLDPVILKLHQKYLQTATTKKQTTSLHG
ncbi:MAG: dephospho-CoA kinase [Gammaproteobacteria bacterium GWE2_42_36]|nr:MAG: dephospho-CoA kinase [Gammaproteobacteria bacterium GWE2_42_36]HCU05470.1 dephospho-CoA kinase [Coxiellaceae bacterium]